VCINNIQYLHNIPTKQLKKRQDERSKKKGNQTVDMSTTDFKCSETKKNLMRAFAGESLARNRYTFAAAECERQGYQALKLMFLFTANQEKEHAELYYKHLQDFAGETVYVEGGYPAEHRKNVIGMLRAAAQNELTEYYDVYRRFEEKAKEEGFPQIAEQFQMIREADRIHGERFARFADLLEQDRLFVSDVATSWMCLNCGTVLEDTNAPLSCPTCHASQDFFLRLDLVPYGRLNGGGAPRD